MVCWLAFCFSKIRRTTLEVEMFCDLLSLFSLIVSLTATYLQYSANEI